MKFKDMFTKFNKTSSDAVRGSYVFREDSTYAICSFASNVLFLMCSKHFENRLTKAKIMSKNIFE